MTEVSTVTIMMAKPGSAADVEQVLSTLSDAACSQAGYARYSSQRDLEDSDVFVTIERWDTEESVQVHVAQALIGEVLCRAEHLLAMPPRVIYLQGCDAESAPSIVERARVATAG